MQVHFERSLVTKYSPYLIPHLKKCIFAKDEVDVYFSSKLTKFPFSLIYRTSDDDFSFRRRLQFDDNASPGKTMTTGDYYPYKQSYSMKVFVEKNSEMLKLRDAMRMRYQKDPYVILHDYSEEYPSLPIGIWLTRLGLEDIRSSSSEIGARRCIGFDFEVNLVMTDLEVVPEIEDIEYNLPK